MSGAVRPTDSFFFLNTTFVPIIFLHASNALFLLYFVQLFLLKKLLISLLPALRHLSFSIGSRWWYASLTLLCFFKSLATPVLNTKCTVCELLLSSIAVAVVSPPDGVLLAVYLVVLFRSLVLVASSTLDLFLISSEQMRLSYFGLIVVYQRNNFYLFVGFRF